MKRILAFLSLAVAATAFAGSDTVRVGLHNLQPNAGAAVFLNSSGFPVVVSATNPLPITGGTGGSGGGGDASAANQVTGNTTLSAISGKLPASLGSKTGAASFSIVPASDGVFAVTAGALTDGTSKVRLTDGTNEVGVTVSGADAVSNTTNRLRVASHEVLFNGTSWDRARSGITGATSSVLGYNNVIPVGTYNASPLTLTNGQFAEPQLDSSGQLKVIQPTGFSTSALQTTGNTSLASMDAKMPAQGPAASSASQPITSAVDIVTGSITTQNLVPAGVATAGSAVELSLNGAAGVAFQVTGTYTGALTLQATIDGTNWVTGGGTPVSSWSGSTGQSNVSSGTQNMYQTNVGGFTKVRLTGLSAMTGTAVVTIRSITSTPIIGLDRALPAGSQSIGFVAGNVAEDAAMTANPIAVGGMVRTAVAPTTLIAGDVAKLTMTSGASLVTKPFSVPNADWKYVAASGGISNTTTAVTIQAAGAASVKNYITGVQIMAEALTNATELAIRDGAAGTVIFRTKIPTGGLPLTNIQFISPLSGTAATLLEVVTLTASGTGAVYVNAQGYQAP